MSLLIFYRPYYIFQMLQGIQSWHSNLLEVQIILRNQSKFYQIKIKKLLQLQEARFKANLQRKITKVRALLRLNACNHETQNWLILGICLMNCVHNKDSICIKARKGHKTTHSNDHIVSLTSAAFLLRCGITKLNQWSFLLSLFHYSTYCIGILLCSASPRKSNLFYGPNKVPHF